MSKWKLELKAPFLGIAPESHRNPVNDSFCTYGDPTQSRIYLGIHYDCTNPNYLSPSPKLYEVTGASTTDLVKYISDYCIPYQGIYENAYAIGKTNLYGINTASGVYATHAVTNMADGQSVVYYKGKLYYFYNTASAGEIGTFDLNTTYDDDWGSTVPTGKMALELAIHPVTSYKDNIIFGNGRYLGKTTDTTLVAQYIDYGVGTIVSDVAVTGSYLYVSVTFPSLGTKKRTMIYKYDALLKDTDPIDGINVKYEVTALRAINGVVYVFYGDQSFRYPSEGYLGYISGSQVVLLTIFAGKSPLFNQVTEYRGYLAFMDNIDAHIYLYGQYDRGTNNILIPYSSGINVTVGCLANPFNNLMFSGQAFNLFTKLYRLPYNTDSNGYYYKYSKWMSVAQIVGDSSNDSIIDDITVFTNTLYNEAGVTLRIFYSDTCFQDLEITGYNKSKHVFRNLNIPVDMFAIRLNWEKYSEINPCLIRKIIINGHTRTK